MRSPLPQDYIERHRPFAIAVGCDRMVTDRVIRDLQRCASNTRPAMSQCRFPCKEASAPHRILEEVHRDDREDAPRIRLELVNPEAARLYAASQRAKDEYPDLSVCNALLAPEV